MKISKAQDVYCPNKECSNYRMTGSNNNIVRSGIHRGKQRYRCNICGKHFVSTVDTVFYNKKLPKNEIILICKLLVEKNSIRSIERITGHHRDTIGNLVSDLAAHCREVTDFLLKDVKLTNVEVDEMWSFIKKNKRTLSKEILKTMETVISGYT